MDVAFTRRTLLEATMKNDRSRDAEMKKKLTHQAIQRTEKPRRSQDTRTLHAHKWMTGRKGIMGSKDGSCWKVEFPVSNHGREGAERDQGRAVRGVRESGEKFTDT